MDVAFEWKSHAPKIFQKLNLYTSKLVITNGKKKHTHSHTQLERENVLAQTMEKKSEKNNENFQRNAFTQLLLNLIPCH